MNGAGAQAFFSGTAYVGGGDSGAGGTGIVNVQNGFVSTTNALKVWNTGSTAVNMSGERYLSARSTPQAARPGSTGQAARSSSGMTTASSTFASAGSGSGSLTKSGTGTLTLTGANTNTGATTISAGTLQLGNGGATGSLGAGNIANSGVLAVNRNNTISILTNITGSGSLNVIAGILILRGANSYAGTLPSSSVLQIDNGGATGTLGAGDVINNGALTFNSSIPTSLLQITSPARDRFSKRLLAPRLSPSPAQTPTPARRPSIPELW